MAREDSNEISFQGCEMVVSPRAGTMNRQKSARQLSVQIDAALEQPRPDLLTDLVMDLNQVDWISSVGLNELIQIHRRTRASGISLRLKSLNATLRDVFRITRLERMFEFDVEDTETVHS